METIAGGLQDAGAQTLVVSSKLGEVTGDGGTMSVDHRFVPLLLPGQ